MSSSPLDLKRFAPEAIDPETAEFNRELEAAERSAAEHRPVELAELGL